MLCGQTQERRVVWSDISRMRGIVLTASLTIVAGTTIAWESVTRETCFIPWQLGTTGRGFPTRKAPVQFASSSCPDDPSKILYKLVWVVFFNPAFESIMCGVVVLHVMYRIVLCISYHIGYQIEILRSSMFDTTSDIDIRCDNCCRYSIFHTNIRYPTFGGAISCY